MPARYDRFFKFGPGRNQLPECLSPGGKLAMLPRLDLAALLPEEPTAIDVQLRENGFGCLMFYSGTTCLLKVTLDRNQNLRLTAHKSFAGADSPFRTSCLAIMRKWPPTTEELPRVMADYLKRALIGTRDTARWQRHYWKRKEGYWQNLIAIKKIIRLGDCDWTVVDREAVIGFENTPNKTAFYAGIRQPYEKLRNDLQKTDESTWGRPRGTKPFGDEADLLAIGPRRQLLCLELKYGANKIYWSPLQAAVYRDAFNDKIGEVSSGICQMVRHKVELGLLPPEVVDWLPAPGSAFQSVTAAVALAKPPAASSQSWSRLKMVRDQGAKDVPIYRVDQAAVFSPVL